MLVDLFIILSSLSLQPVYHRENASINLELRSTNNIPVDSPLLRHYESMIKKCPSSRLEKNNEIIYLDQPIDDFPQQSTRKTVVPITPDEINHIPLAKSSTQINSKQSIPVIQSSLSSDVPSENSSRSTTPIPSPELHIPVQLERRRSMSPPLPPQMSPDNGRPLPHLPQTTSQRSMDEHAESSQRSKSSSSRTPVRSTALTSR